METGDPVRGIVSTQSHVRTASQLVEAEAIIADLAENEPMYPVESEYGIEHWVCALCEVHASNIKRAPFHDEWEHIDHANSCPWQRAYKAMKVAPSSGE